MKRKVLKDWVVGCLLSIMLFNFILLGSIKDDLNILHNILAIVIPMSINILIAIILYKYSKIFEV